MRSTIPSRIAGLFLCVWSLCSASAFASEFTLEQPGSSTMRVMYYNVLNLFDNEHDSGKEDWEFLPKSFPGKAEACQRVKVPKFRQACLSTDWTDAHLAVKISQIAKAVRATSEFLPDILGLEEVENENVVALLADELGYDRFWVTNSPDGRGIDVAIMAKTGPNLEYVRHKEIELRMNEQGGKATRNLLGVDFLVGGQQQLSVFVNHWPSQANPTTNRLVAARALQAVIDETLRRNPQAAIVAGGDLNTIPDEHPHPLESVLFHPKSPNPLHDVHALFLADTSVSLAEKRALNPGTYFYAKDQEWNVLDRIMVNENLLAGKGMQIQIDTYKIHAMRSVSQPAGKIGVANGGDGKTWIPWPANHQTLNPDQAGFSDHYPISVELSIR